MAVQISGNDITVPRDGSFTRNVTIGGTLTYEDVTNIDSVGLVTARNGIEIGARPGVAASISVDGNMIISGISTFGDNIRIVDSKKLLFGNLAAGDCQIIHDGTDTFIQNKTGDLKIANNVGGDVGGDIIIQAMNGEDSVKAIHDGAVELYHDNNKRLSTYNEGIEVFGIEGGNASIILSADEVKINFDKSLYDIIELDANGNVDFDSNEFETSGSGNYLNFKVKVEKIRVEGEGSELVTSDVKMFSDGFIEVSNLKGCLLYTSPSPRDGLLCRLPSYA